LIVVVLDACFLIVLRDTGRLDLLGKVAQPMSWVYYAPEAVYSESTARRPTAETVERLVEEGTIHRCVVPEPLCSQLKTQYASLARGEVEALAFAVTERDRGEEVLVVSDDVKAKNAAGDLGLDVLGILDFLRSCHGAGVMSGEEVKRYLPSLRRNFEIKEDKLKKFLVSLGLS
jgi:predicted nucleic acid-binding protein